MPQKKAAGQSDYFIINIITAQRSSCSVIVATLVLDGTPARHFVAYTVSLSRFLIYISNSVNRGCPDVCTYEEPKEVKKRR
jgi:hypothetical protein